MDNLDENNLAIEDIYADIDDFDLGKTVDTLQKENKDLKDYVESQELEKKKLKLALEEMKTAKQSLANNISSLFRTAKSELERRDTIIADLRKQLDNMAFRRRGSHVQNHLNRGIQKLPNVSIQVEKQVNQKSDEQHIKQSGENEHTQTFSVHQKTYVVEKETDKHDNENNRLNMFQQRLNNCEPTYINVKEQVNTQKLENNNLETNNEPSDKSEFHVRDLRYKIPRKNDKISYKKNSIEKGKQHFESPLEPPGNVISETNRDGKSRYACRSDGDLHRTHSRSTETYRNERHNHNRNNVNSQEHSKHRQSDKKKMLKVVDKMEKEKSNRSETQSQRSNKSDTHRSRKNDKNTVREGKNKPKVEDKSEKKIVVPLSKERMKNEKDHVKEPKNYFTDCMSNILESIQNNINDKISNSDCSETREKLKKHEKKDDPNHHNSESFITTTRPQKSDDNLNWEMIMSEDDFATDNNIKESHLNENGNQHRKNKKKKRRRESSPELDNSLFEEKINGLSTWDGHLYAEHEQTKKKKHKKRKREEDNENIQDIIKERHKSKHKKSKRKDSVRLEEENSKINLDFPEISLDHILRIDKLIENKFYSSVPEESESKVKLKEKHIVAKKDILEEGEIEEEIKEDQRLLDDNTRKNEEKVCKESIFDNDEKLEFEKECKSKESYDNFIRNVETEKTESILPFENEINKSRISNENSLVDQVKVNKEKVNRRRSTDSSSSFSHHNNAKINTKIIGKSKESNQNKRTASNEHVSSFVDVDDELSQNVKHKNSLTSEAPNDSANDLCIENSGNKIDKKLKESISISSPLKYNTGEKRKNSKDVHFQNEEVLSPKTISKNILNNMNVSFSSEFLIVDEISEHLSEQIKENIEENKNVQNKLVEDNSATKLTVTLQSSNSDKITNNNEENIANIMQGTIKVQNSPFENIVTPLWTNQNNNLPNETETEANLSFSDLEHSFKLKKEENSEKKIVIVSDILLHSGTSIDSSLNNLNAGFKLSNFANFNSNLQESKETSKLESSKEIDKLEEKPEDNKQTKTTPYKSVSKKDILLERYASDESQNKLKLTHKSDENNSKEIKNVLFKTPDNEIPKVKKQENLENKINSIRKRKISEEEEKILAEAPKIYLPKKRNLDFKQCQTEEINIENIQHEIISKQKSDTNVSSENLEKNIRNNISQGKDEIMKNLASESKKEDNNVKNESTLRRGRSRSKSVNEKIVSEIDKSPRRSPRKLQRKSEETRKRKEGKTGVRRKNRNIEETKNVTEVSKVTKENDKDKTLNYMGQNIINDGLTSPKVIEISSILSEPNTSLFKDQSQNLPTSSTKSKKVVSEEVKIKTGAISQEQNSSVKHQLPPSLGNIPVTAAISPIGLKMSGQKPRKRITPIPVKDTPVCTFKNILEKNDSQIKIFSKNFNMEATLNLTDEGEIPILHLEENHFSNMEDATQKTFDRSIIKLLDCMNVSNLDCDISKLNYKVEEPIPNKRISFENVVDTASSVSSNNVVNIHINKSSTTPVKGQISQMLTSTPRIDRNAIVVTNENIISEARSIVENKEGTVKNLNSINQYVSGLNKTVNSANTSMDQPSTSSSVTNANVSSGPVRFRRRCRMVAVRRV